MLGNAPAALNSRAAACTACSHPVDSKLKPAPVQTTAPLFSPPQVLELCSGGELVGATRSGRHYSERTAASFLRAVLRTVAQCHAKRIIHRDIKPENVGCRGVGCRRHREVQRGALLGWAVCRVPSHARRGSATA